MHMYQRTRHGQALTEWAVGIAVVACAAIIGLALVSGAAGGVYSSITSSINSVIGPGTSPSASPTATPTATATATPTATPTPSPSGSLAPGVPCSDDFNRLGLNNPVGGCGAWVGGQIANNELFLSAQDNSYQAYIDGPTPVFPLYMTIDLVDYTTYDASPYLTWHVFMDMTRVEAVLQEDPLTSTWSLDISMTNGGNTVDSGPIFVSPPFQSMLSLTVTADTATAGVDNTTISVDRTAALPDPIAAMTSASYLSFYCSAEQDWYLDNLRLDNHH